VAGVEEHHPEGIYALRYRNSGGHRCWETVGKDGTIALAAKLRKEKELAARRSAAEAGLTLKDKEGHERVRLSDAIVLYLADAKLQKAKRTYGERRYGMELFQRVCTKVYLDDVDRSDFNAFITFLRAHIPALADRTVHNRCSILKGFLRANGITDVITRKDLPCYTKKTVDAYSEDELRVLFAAANDNERLIFQFFLGSGARESEVTYACWSDINFRDKTFSVTEKRDLGFIPKDREERVIPLPDPLVKALKERYAQSRGTRLIFPNKQGRPNGHFLRMLKKLAKRAGLNCGQCFNVGKGKRQSCLKAPVCDRFELHKFRRSFATLHHEAGVPARQVQQWLGHSDLSTTLRYLAIADDRSQKTRDRVNNSFAFLRPKEKAASAPV
jgi:integrase